MGELFKHGWGMVEGVPTYLHVEKINAESEKKIHKPILGQLTRTQQS